MAKDKVPHLVKKPGRDGKPRYYWQPSRRLREMGCRPARLADNPEEAARQAAERNADLGVASPAGTLSVSPVRTPRRCWIYFIRAKGGQIKIGKSTDLPGRLVTLQIAHPERITLIGAVFTDERVEAALHAEFSREQLSGEWFQPTLQIIARIDGLTRR